MWKRWLEPIDQNRLAAVLIFSLTFFSRFYL